MSRGGHASEESVLTVKMTSSTLAITALGRRSFVDLTDELAKAVEAAGISDGFAVAFTSHTTCTLIINEWEDGVLSDLSVRLSQLVPEQAYYAHDDLTVRTQNVVDEERENGPAHVANMILGGTSHTIPIFEAKPVLGRWQRLFLFELDDPKVRTVRIHTYGI